MRALCTLVAAISLSAGASLAFGARQDFRPSPPFLGTELPAPPRQSARWTTPASTLPPAFVSATRTLLVQGLPAPRGCEYREIEVGTGDCFAGDAGVFRTHGWVLPATKDTTGRFAIGWNGLVYPTVSVGERADLAADTMAIINADAVGRAEYARKNPGHPYMRSLDWAASERESLSFTRLTPLKACLLLLAGEDELTQRYWQAFMDAMPSAAKDNDARDPYLLLATDWAWALFDRALGAHMRGDDRLALLSCRALMPIRDAIEAEAAKRGYPQPDRFLSSPAEKDHPLYLAFLKPLPALSADQERRAKAAPPQRFSLSSVTAERDRTRRIAGLVQSLEEVSKRQDSEPGSIMLAGDPIVAALIREGEGTVEPLVTCLETDNQLTRSVGFGRSFHRDRYLIPVRSAAYVALAGVLNTDELAPRRGESPPQTAARIRAYWQKNKGLPEAERWFRTLADDTAQPDQWAKVANRITQRTNVSTVPGSAWVSFQETKPGKTPSMRGETLRAKAHPSVAELMVKRIGQMSDMASESRGAEIALCLAEWDPEAAGPVLPQQVQQVIARQKPTDYSSSQLIARLTLARLHGGDPEAAQDYAMWLRGGKLDPRQVRPNEVLEPLWRYPHDRVLSELAEWLFNDPASSWSRVSAGAGELYSLVTLPNSPLLGVSGYRTHLLKALEDPSEVGMTSVEADGRSVRIRSPHADMSAAVDYRDPLRPRVGESVPVRMNDVYAWRLSSTEGMPAFQPYWPQAKRDAAIAAIVTHLQTYGERYALDATLPDAFYAANPFDRIARMSFPRRSRPATAQEVANGTAIFAFEPQVQVRVVEMPSPLSAKWTTLKKYGRDVKTMNKETGEIATTTSYDQQVTVWQAEEAFVDGRWQRFFGVVGPHELARVPAEEIDLVAGNSPGSGKPR